MKKIIVAFDGLKLSDNALQYGVMLGKTAPAHIVGVSLESMLYNSFSPYEVAAQCNPGDQTVNKLTEADQQCRNASVEYFMDVCQFAGLDCSVHRDKYFALDDLLKESIYADLLVIDTHETMSREMEAAPTTFIHRMLPDVQCPVFLVNGDYQDVDKVMVLFDGSPASVHAIKMFQYTLPGLNTLPMEIVTVNNGNNEGNHLPDQKLIKEFIKRHHPNAHYTVLHGQPSVQITGHLQQHTENTLVVMGACHRKSLSRFFHESLADKLVKSVKCPLFIANR